MNNDELRARPEYRILFVIEAGLRLLAIFYATQTHTWLLLLLLVLFPLLCSFVRERVKIINSRHLVEPVSPSVLGLTDDAEKSKPQITIILVNPAINIISRESDRPRLELPDRNSDGAEN